MIREYIRAAIPQVNFLPSDGTLRGAINQRIKSSILSWQGPNAIRPDGTLQSAVEYEVNTYMLSITEEERKARKQAIDNGHRDPEYNEDRSLNTRSSSSTTTKTKRNKGNVTVTCVNPPKGQIEDGTIISFTSVYELFLNDVWPYTYNTATGIYTVYTGSKGKVAPLYGVISDSVALSEQNGSLFFTQSPDIASSTSVITKIDKITLKNSEDQLCFRLGANLGCYIKNKVYTEFKNTKTGDPPVTTVDIVKTLDLSTYLPTSSRETITIGKYLLFGDVLAIMVFTDSRYTTHFGEDDDYDMGRMYNNRRGGATIKGELLLINRTTWKIKKLSTTATAASHQIRFTGFIDMLVDHATGKLITAELSTSSASISLHYYTALLKVTPADRPNVYPRPTTDVEKHTVAEWYAWLSSEVYHTGFPKAVKVVSTGSKDWELLFPKLKLNLYTVNSGVATSATGASDPSLTLEKLLYEDTGTTFSNKHGIVGAGGYVNCMLYQDIFATGYPLYIARSYDFWTQIPFDFSSPDGYTVIPENAANGNFHADKGKYVASPLPGELSGIFGTAYHRLDMPSSGSGAGTLAFVADIPGDFGACRSFMDQDEAGWRECISGACASTEITLYCHNTVGNNVRMYNDYIDHIRVHSVFNTFSGGPGVSDFAFPNVVHATMGYQYLWAIGLHTHSQRFAIIHSKADPNKIALVMGGSYEPQNKAYSDGQQVYSHQPENTVMDKGCCGVFISTLEPNAAGQFSVGNGCLMWPLVQKLNHAVEPKWQPFLQYHSNQFTMYSTRCDIKVYDASTYYTAISSYIHQYDFFALYSGLYAGGLLWWAMDRQMWRYDGTQLTGWGADPEWNDTRGTERIGAETVQLQLF